MPSTFAWLDYSEHERRKMLDVIELFGERVTRDELGLAGVRDAFADKLFPGISTIQTRARYFLFVPWMYQMLEEKRVASAIASDRERKIEVQLIQALEQTDDRVGTIGLVAKGNVRRLSASVYWQGLSTWGIRLFPGSQDEYYRSLDAFYTRTKAADQTSREFDGESFRLEGLRNWQPQMPQRPGQFPAEASFALTKAESLFLREQILQHIPESLIAFLVREQLEIGDFQFAWDLVADLPPRLVEWIHHGRNFSEILHGAALLYNLMLSEKANWQERRDSYQEELSDWWETMLGRWEAFINW